MWGMGMRGGKSGTAEGKVGEEKSIDKKIKNGKGIKLGEENDEKNKIKMTDRGNEGVWELGE